MENNDNKKDSNSVFIGSKPLMNYVTSAVMQLKNSESDLSIKARGKFISKAVDVAEVVRKRFLKDLGPQIKNIKIDTEEYSKEDKQIKVSTIDIILSRSVRNS